MEKVQVYKSEIITTSPLKTLPQHQQKQKQKQIQRNDGNRNGKHKKSKIASRARHRLWSIYRDAQTVQNLNRRCCHHCQQKVLAVIPPPSPTTTIATATATATTIAIATARTEKAINTSTITSEFLSHALQNWKLVTNDRCGSWYVPPSSVSSFPPPLGGEEKFDKDDNDKSFNIGCSCSNRNVGISDFSCYFKSTDGHVNTWEFSLKRLNLPLLEQVLTNDGGCFVVDSSVRKILPDSMSRTIPIWAAVLNRIVLRYAAARENTGNADVDDICSRNYDQWDTNLYTPKYIVSTKEHATISNLIDDRVETLLSCGAIVNPDRLIERLTKPLRTIWMNHKGEILPSNIVNKTHNDDDDDDNHDENGDYYSGQIKTQTTMATLVKDYFVVVCWNPSQYEFIDEDSNDCDSIINRKKTNNNKKKKQNPQWIKNDVNKPGYYYTPGAADDHESWARHLTPTLFWMYQEKLLDPTLDDDQVDKMIDELVENSQKQEYDNINKNNSNEMINQRGNIISKISTFSYCDRIGDTNIWIGSRRAGRPPECWGSGGFDAILNVTNQEYTGIVLNLKKKEFIDDFDGCHINGSNSTEGTEDSRNSNQTKFYLQLPVEEGKRDRIQLERWMTIGLVFIIHHLQRGRRVLIHCAQGKDRSVSVALVFVSVACELQFPLKLRPGFHTWSLPTLVDDSNDNNNDNGHIDSKNDKNHTEITEKDYLSSGIPTALVMRLLKSRNGGRELFLKWVHSQLQKDITSHGCLADKASIRIALHLIRQYREVAEPTRSSIQKTHRFFMSADIYRSLI